MLDLWIILSPLSVSLNKNPYFNLLLSLSVHRYIITIHQHLYFRTLKTFIIFVPCNAVRRGICIGLDGAQATLESAYSHFLRGVSVFCAMRGKSKWSWYC